MGPIQKLEIILWDAFPLSARVDFCLFVLGLKPAVRTKIVNLRMKNKLLDMFSLFDWYPEIDDEGYCVVSHASKNSKLIMEVDKSTSAHEKTLGDLLGYPICCTEYCSYLGESEIDNYANNFQKYSLTENFRFIDIKYYAQGLALISHVPCSHFCEASLFIAESVVKFIKANQKEVGQFAEWRAQLLNYYKIT